MIKLKVFTDQQNARKFRGEIVQAIAHIIKLMHGYDYHQDRSKHIRDIMGWVKLIVNYSNDDKSARGIDDMERFFDKEFPFSKNKMKLGMILKRYDPNQLVLKSEYIYAEVLLFRCMKILEYTNDELRSTEELTKIFPKEGFDDWDKVKAYEEF